MAVTTSILIGGRELGVFSFFFCLCFSIRMFCRADATIDIFGKMTSLFRKCDRSYFALQKNAVKIFATQKPSRDHNAVVCLPSAHVGCKRAQRLVQNKSAQQEQNYALQSPRSCPHYCSSASTIFSLSLRLFFWSLRACLRSFSSFRLIDLISSPLISPAFLTCFGTCLCLPMRRISGMCL